MSTKLTKLALAMGAMVLASSAMAQSSATEASATANATVIRPIAVAKGLSLEFGNIVAGAGTVVIAAATGARTDSTPALTPPAAQRGLIRAATFNVSGEGGAIYSITLPADNTVRLRTNDGIGDVEFMRLDSFTVAKNGGATDLLTLNGEAGGSGSQSFFVGGTLTAVAGQTAGVYSGTYSVTVAYN